MKNNPIQHLPNLKSLAKSRLKTNKKFFSRLKGKSVKQLDKVIYQQHQDVFTCTDCLACANCCKTTGPKFTPKDIERISAYLKLKPSQFSEKYLQIDEEQDTILQQLPCFFLDTDNYCSIYDVRPKACREYPHTDVSGQFKIAKLTLKNSEICPAVYEILERVKSAINR